MDVVEAVTTRLSLHRARVRLRSSAVLGDPVARILDLPRGRPGYARYERIRDAGDLVRGRSGLFMTATHATCSEVLRSKDFGAARTATAKFRLRPPEWQHSKLLVHPLDDSFASMDPPEHTRLRKIVAPWFTPAAMRDRRALVEKVVQEHLDRLDPAAPVDLIGDFAVRVPSQVICALLGLPTGDHALFCRWGIEFGATVDGARSPADLRLTRTLLAEMADYFADLAAQRRREPAEDLISALVESVGQGEMTEAGMLATAQALLIGGFVTTANIIGNGVVELIANPGQRERFVADPGLAGNLVEEVLRLEAPAQYCVRVAREPTVLAGQELRRGTPVVTLLGGANRDPAVFAAPARFDITRPNVREHLSFAAGIHYCIGAGLARMEGEIALRALFERFPGITAAGPVTYCPSRVIRGPQYLPVTCRPRA